MAFINTAIILWMLQKYLLYFRVRAVGSAIVIVDWRRKSKRGSEEEREKSKRASERERGRESGAHFRLVNK